MWAKKVKWDMSGGVITAQGDCSAFKGIISYSGKEQPIVVDLMSDAPYNKQYTNCCKGIMLSASRIDKKYVVSTFEVIVGRAETLSKQLNCQTISL
jgi:hypothetical protein